MRPPEGYNYVCLPETGSTIDDAFRLAGDGGDYVVVAGRQTSGRGQHGRAYSCGEGGLYLSMTFRPRAADIAETPLLTRLAGEVVRRAVFKFTGVLPEVKLPNDLLIAGRKICGILTEARAGEDFLMVFGIGVNLRNELPAELSGVAGNLLELTGSAPSPEELAEEITNRLYEALT